MKAFSRQLYSSLRQTSMRLGGRNTHLPQACITFSRPISMDCFDFVCDVEAEPLHRYRPGGYHPVHIGDVLKNGRYRILHKLGWGGYSTVWAARDERAGKNVAIKIAVSEKESGHQESKIMEMMKTTKSAHPGRAHLVSLIDCFRLHGPNGMHHCLVLDITGPSISDIIDRRLNSQRLPGKWAMSIATQTLRGLECLHEHGIAHGDLHVRNIACTVPSLDSLGEAQFLQQLTSIELGAVQTKGGKTSPPGVPDYLVTPASFRMDMSTIPFVRIIDFGESFIDCDPPSVLHTPLVFRAPEAIFRDKLDHRVDLWSIGCTLFELYTGQPPFDTFLITPASLISQILATTGEDLPTRWQSTLPATLDTSALEPSGVTLQEWLEEVYFDHEREADFTAKEITHLGELINKLLRLEPVARVSIKQLLQDDWFQRD